MNSKEMTLYNEIEELRREIFERDLFLLELYKETKKKEDPVDILTSIRISIRSEIDSYA